MKIAFFASACIPFHARSIAERPLGGTESAIVYLAEALVRLGHEIIVFTPEANPPLSNPLYVPHRALQDLGEVDVFVAVRDWKCSLLPVRARRRYFWTGDSYDQPATLGVGDRRVAAALNGMLCVSEWQRQTFCRASGFPAERMYVLGNGVCLDHFTGLEERAPKRLMYSSTPFRGLELLAKIFPRISAVHQEAELHVFSGYDVYAGAMGAHDPRIAQFEAISRLLRAVPRCFLHGNVVQSQLAREYLRSSVFAYPNTFEETSCIVAMEAQAAGCVIVTSKKGALPETVGDAGVLIEGDPREDAYLDRFVAETNRLLSDPSLWNAYSLRGRERAKSFSWDRVAERFMEIVRGDGRST